ncbi:MAG: ATP-dependent helicase/nuclease subunit B [Cellvibrionaceae bacterium]|jgi:ATP-dependent helicase/nuclease subunit B
MSANKLPLLPPLFRLETILDAIKDGRVILTANQRLRDHAQQAWAQYQKSQGALVWKPAKIFNLTQWFDYCWERLQTYAYEPSFQGVISPQQERVLWEKITADIGLMRPEVLAKQAANAYRTLQLWQLSLPQLDNESSAETKRFLGTETFKQWCLDYEKALKKRGLLTFEQRLSIIIRAVIDGVLPREETICLLGFSDLPPLHQATLDRLSTAIIKVDLCNFQPQKIQRLVLADRQKEIQMAALWSRAILDNTPHVRIGIIIPNLAGCRAQVERVFREVFDGRALWAERPADILPINISAGVPLGETPLITDTLELLRLYQNQWDIQVFLQLLNSPFWGKLNLQRSLRAQLAKQLGTLGVFKLSLSEVRHQLQRLSEKSGKGDLSLLQLFSTSAEYVRQQRKSALPSQWVERFLKLLDLMQWPGERPSDSLEHQQTRRWYELLESFATLDRFLGNVSATSAIQQLTLMARQQPFQPELPDTPIQILGVLEAAGLYFDHCWVLGLDQQTWPPAPQPNPMLPVSLQRRHNMPHASHERELSFARLLTQQLRHSGKNLVFSSPGYDPETELPRSPSHLIKDIALFSQPETSLNDFEAFSQRLFEDGQFERVSCTQGPPVSASDINTQGELSGGAGVVKAQANNPFDAFAVHRLNARRPQSAVPGFSAIEQGDILHRSLAAIWQQIGNQQNLLAMADEQCRALVQRTVSEVVGFVRQRKPNHLGHQLCELESQRQATLILKWLAYEKKRPDFTVVSIEESLYFHYREVKLKMRVDRVDRLADESFLILDYKTGLSNLRQWQGERPADPQLPLYLIAYQQPVVGIAFAQININKQILIGLEDGKHPIDGLSSIESIKLELPDNWDQAKDLWQQRIQHLLDGYLAGQCSVDYRDSLSLRYNSDLLALNRYFDKYRI